MSEITMENKENINKDIVEEFEEDTQKCKYLTFPLGKVTYAIEIKYVTEIIGIQPVTQMPQVPEYVKGIINLRGKIIPVMDVRIKFGKEPIEYDDRTSIIVVDVDDISLGLIVDCVSEVLQIPDDDIVLPPDLSETSENKYIKEIGKVGNEVSLILNCEKLISENNEQDLMEELI